MFHNTNSLTKIKIKYKKYLTIVFVLSVSLLIIMPTNIKTYIPIIYIFLTFVFFGILNFSLTTKLEVYLISNHSKELKELKINDSIVGFNRLQKQFLFKQKIISEISPIVNDGLELVFFYGKLIMISFFSTILLFFILMLILQFSK